MTELIIKERRAGDVTILDCEGDIRIGESSLALRTAIRHLAEIDRNKIVLNLAGIRYIDSSGIGEISANSTLLAKSGGGLAIAYLTEKVQDLLTITKLLSAFDCYDSIEEAVNAFHGDHVNVFCPVHGCGNLIAFPNLGRKTVDQCRKCGAKFYVRRRSVGANPAIAISSVWLPTYDGEYINITPGAPTMIEVLSRLDLFASEVLDRAWLTVPSPRRVIFKLGARHEITPAGVQKVLALCGQQEAGTKAVILTSEKVKLLFPAGTPIYDDAQIATKALKIPNSAPWILSLERVS